MRGGKKSAKVYDLNVLPEIVFVFSLKAHQQQKITSGVWVAESEDDGKEVRLTAGNRD